MVKYSQEPAVSENSCKARGDDLRVHFKNTFETANAIKGMSVPKARIFLEDVLEHKQCVPFRRYVHSIGRCAQAKHWKVTLGKWPEKSCKFVLNILANAESTARAKDLDLDNLIVSHVAVQKAQKGRRRTYRAHGRINAYKASNCHVELFLTTRDSNVPKPQEKTEGKLTKKQAAKKRLALGGGH
mmetsp:Transcript_7309/g.8005  ORF Transcript_7309/g.8005 Transcript_7309/m.8005 type:complete len:185 (-) Transcript_7309:427-981(-)